MKCKISYFYFLTGSPATKVTEEDGKRYIESTGQFAGTELHLFTEVSKKHIRSLPCPNKLVLTGCNLDKCFVKCLQLRSHTMTAGFQSVRIDQT
jgi:hypothetical protein